MIYGSGLRNGDANIGTVPPYAQFNAGPRARIPAARRPQAGHGALRRRQPVRHDLPDPDGSGIGVFAPQYGPRRGYFVGISKKL